MPLLTLWRKCEIHVFLDHKWFSICDSVTSLPCGLGKNGLSINISNGFQRKCHGGKKVNQHFRKAEVAAGSNSTRTGFKMPTAYSIHCRDLPQISHLQCEHPKNKFLFNIPPFYLPSLVHCLLPRNSILGMQVGIFSFCKKKKDILLLL